MQGCVFMCKRTTARQALLLDINEVEVIECVHWLCLHRYKGRLDMLQASVGAGKTASSIIFCIVLSTC